MRLLEKLYERTRGEWGSVDLRQTSLVQLQQAAWTRRRNSMLVSQRDWASRARALRNALLWVGSSCEWAAGSWEAARAMDPRCDMDSDVRQLLAGFSSLKNIMCRKKLFKIYKRAKFWRGVVLARILKV